MSHTPSVPFSPADFQVVEFRRYTIVPGGRETFVRYFEHFFPESFQQLGCLALGQGYEAGRPDGFSWLRGFRSMEARAVACASFYYGPVWQEHRATLNALIVDSDDVYLMQPLPGRGVAVMPAVDPLCEPKGAGGVVVAQLFTVSAGRVDELAALAEAGFARYRAEGVREVGVLVTLDAVNSFPQLPVRQDGPYLLWLGLLPDAGGLASWQAMASRQAEALMGSGLLRAASEQIVLTPSARSRLRWQVAGEDSQGVG